jgi:hypothetical protein
MRTTTPKMGARRATPSFQSWPCGVATNVKNCPSATPSTRPKKTPSPSRLTDSTAKAERKRTPKATRAATTKPLRLGPGAIARRTNVVPTSESTVPSVTFDDTAFEMKMSTAVYQGSARSRLAKMLVTLGTTTIIMTVMSTVPMMSMRIG